jgi:hypothetical protein
VIAPKPANPKPEYSLKPSGLARRDTETLSLFALSIPHSYRAIEASSLIIRMSAKDLEVRLIVPIKEIERLTPSCSAALSESFHVCKIGIFARTATGFIDGGCSFRSIGNGVRNVCACIGNTNDV